jgi:hypothetical protein
LFVCLGGIVKQLAVIPSRFSNCSYCDDSPTDAIISSYAVYENDLIIIASDGLWDNLSGIHSSFTSMFGSFTNQSNTEVDKKLQMKKRIETIIKQAHNKYTAQTQTQTQTQSQKQTNHQQQIKRQKQDENQAEISSSNAASVPFHDPTDVSRARTDDASECSSQSRSRSPSSSCCDDECMSIACAFESEAFSFMSTFDGKPDDLTIIVAKVKTKILE